MAHAERRKTPMHRRYDKYFICILCAFLVLCPSSSPKDSTVLSRNEEMRNLCWQTWGSDGESERSDFVQEGVGDVEKHLASLLTQEDPPIEALLAYLVPAPCEFEEGRWMLDVLLNLGLAKHLFPNDPNASVSLDQYNFHRLDIDLDRDTRHEIVLYGGGQNDTLFAGVLKWEDTQWQVVWFERFKTRYNGTIRVHADDLTGDGNIELLVETIAHPYSGTGMLGQVWEVHLLQCEHLRCRTIWEYPLARIDEHGLSYTRLSSEYRFRESHSSSKADIEVTQYGIMADWDYVDVYRSVRFVAANTMTVTQRLYSWDGDEYTQTMETILADSALIDINPTTTTLAIDGFTGYAVYNWLPDDEMKLTLSIYSLDSYPWYPTQIFTASVTGDPNTGIFLRDTNADEQLDLIVCQTTFVLDAFLDDRDDWPLTQTCTIHEWDAARLLFR
jgi:hypothetical protein